MLSLIEVKCPHCGAQGQIMLPPLGAIIVGPCPECEGMVVVFCGRVLPLDKDTMTMGSVEEKKDHLIEVLTTFLQERIERLFENEAAQAEVTAMEEDDSALDDELEDDDQQLLDEAEEQPVMQAPLNFPKSPISSEEMDVFVNQELRLIDNKHYFKAVLG